jgi:hypothetical protein
LLDLRWKFGDSHNAGAFLLFKSQILSEELDAHPVIVPTIAIFIHHYSTSRGVPGSGE